MRERSRLAAAAPIDPVGSEAAPRDPASPISTITPQRQQHAHTDEQERLAPADLVGKVSRRSSAPPASRAECPAHRTPWRLPYARRERGRRSANGRRACISGLAHPDPLTREQQLREVLRIAAQRRHCRPDRQRDGDQASAISGGAISNSARSAGPARYRTARRRAPSSVRSGCQTGQGRGWIGSARMLTIWRSRNNT